MEIVLHPAYFPNIYNFAHILKYDVIWEVFDNFQKQTYRNRCYIATDTGPLLLSIPVKHQKGQGRQLYRDTQIDYSFPWRRDHWRSLTTAYRSSPFFEFYEDDFLPLFTDSYTGLMEFNLATIKLSCELMNVDFPKRQTTSYRPVIDDLADGRNLVVSKGNYPQEIPPYIQVFSDRLGFLPDLSILDLLFNLGTEASSYLKQLGESLTVR